MMSCVGFEVYKFSEPPSPSATFFSEPPLRVSKNFRSAPSISSSPPLVILNELSLKMGIRLTSTFIALNQLRSMRQMLTIFSGVEF